MIAKERYKENTSMTYEVHQYGGKMILLDRKKGEAGVMKIGVIQAGSQVDKNKILKLPTPYRCVEP